MIISDLLQLQSSLIQENFGITAPIANSYSWDFTVSMEPLWLDCEFARKRDSRFPKKNTCYWKNITCWYLASWWDLSYLEGFYCFLINPFFFYPSFIICFPCSFSFSCHSSSAPRGMHAIIGLTSFHNLQILLLCSNLNFLQMVSDLPYFLWSLDLPRS